MNARAPSAVLLAVARTGARLVAVGDRGTIVLSDDEGRSWRQAPVPVSTTLTGITFDPTGRGWAVGHCGVVLRSDDGGERWSKQLDGRRAATLVHERAAARVAAGQVDAAARLAEAERLVAEGPDKPFFDLTFVDRDRGFIVGAYGLLFATQDAGQSWIPWQDRLPVGEARHLYGVRAVGREIYLAGEQGALFRSRDAGDSFTALTSPYEGSFFGVLAGPSASDVLVFGLRGHVFHSDDAGASWQPGHAEGKAALTAGLLGEDGTLLLSTQAGHLLRSLDQGRSWLVVPPRLPAPAMAMLKTRDGALLVVGARGAARIDLSPTPPAPQPRRPGTAP